MANNQIKALAQSGAAHCKAKEFDAAIADFTKVLEANPNIAALWYNRGYAWYCKGNKVCAIADWEKAAALEPDNAKYQDALKKTRGAAGKIKSDLIENRQIRVFISSTFKDMEKERNYLVRNVFPGLRRYCEDRDVTFQDIDLRWGILEKESKQGKVVDICLKEIRNTTPFFIGLLGSRYGWVPNDKEREKIKDTGVFDLYDKEYAWIEEELKNKGMSITEVEIQEGVLRAKEKVYAYFYFRSPQMDVSKNEDYKEEDYKEKPKSDGEEKLRRLKATLKEQKTYPVVEYDDIEPLGALVERDFKALVDRLFPLEEVPSELEKERREQRAYLKRMTAVYVPVPESEKYIDEFVESAERGFVITGEIGSGKSALLAHWIQNRRESPNEKIIYHFTGQSGDEGDYRKIIRRLIKEIQDLYKIQPTQHEQPGNDDNRQKKELEDLLFALRNEGRLIIILDGVDKLSGNDAKRFKWLPVFPDNCKFIFSTQESWAFSSQGYKVIEVKTLDIERRKALIEKYLDLFGKKLTSDQIKRIAKDKENENPLALRVLLDELRVFGKHDELNIKIDEYLAADSIPELFTLALDRCENTYGKDLVREALSLLYVARRGLSEREIRAFTGTAPLYWSQLFYGMAGHLMVRNGMITLSHNFIREAVKNRYLPDDTAAIASRKKLMESLSAPDADVSPARKYEEMAHQLFECADWDNLYHTLLDFKILRYLDINELAKYWGALCNVDQQKYVLKQYLKLPSEGRTPVKMAELFLKLCDVATAIGYNFSAIAFADELIRLDKNNTTAYLTRGNVYQYGRQDYDRAAADYTEALRINPKYAEAYYNRGNAAYRNGKRDYERAIADYTEAIRLDPKYANAYNLRGQAYYKGKKDYNNAIADFTEAIRLNPNIAMYFFNRGVAYHIGKQDYDQAIADYTEALHINPDDSDAANNLEVAKKDKEKEDGTLAVRTIKKIVFGLIIMAGMSYNADWFDDGWLHSLAIIVNIAGMVWFAQTIIYRTIVRHLQIINANSIRNNKHINVFITTLILLLVLLGPAFGVGISIHFIKGRKAGNPVSIVLQNPFEAARKHFFGAGKNDTSDMPTDIFPPASQEANNTGTAGGTADKGAKND
jgi:tetratricopeptide (TPR) repeat protein